MDASDGSFSELASSLKDLKDLINLKLDFKSVGFIMLIKQPLIAMEK